MLQYALLHLFGYKLSMDDLKAFRVSFPHHEDICLTLTVLHSMLTASHLVILKAMTPKVLKSQLGPLDRGSPMLLALLLLKHTPVQSSTGQAMTSLPIIRIASLGMGALWKALRAKLPVLLVICS